MPVSVAQGTNTVSYEYDALGRLTRETENGIVKTYSMDNIGNRIASNVGGVETSYTYDALNRLTGVTFDGGSANYDKAGKLTSAETDGEVSKYTYNADNLKPTRTNEYGFVE